MTTSIQVGDRVRVKVEDDDCVFNGVEGVVKNIWVRETWSLCFVATEYGELCFMPEDLEVTP